MRKILVVTGTRAEYGLLYWVMREIESSGQFALQVVATGMHLSPEYGLTYREIEKDGFSIDAKVAMLVSGDTPACVAKSMGLGVIGFADAFEWLEPDLVLLLGDRFEILAAAQAALVAKIPVAHIAGGDTTEGAFDEAIRHSITKMAHLHFVTNPLSAGRVRQLGENPAHIYKVGHPGLDHIRRIQLLSRTELAAELGFSLRERNLLITFHPVTLDEQPADSQFRELLAALDLLGPEIGLIFTKPNADPGGRQLAALVDEYVAARPHARCYTSLGQRRYLSAMAQVDAVVGNSSSGLYEAPSFGKPTVNIGDRQKGRLQASSVVNCPPQRNEIARAIGKALRSNCAGTRNPYGDGEASRRIVEILGSIADYQALIKKHFFGVD